MGDLELTGRTALVTGGTAGIGLASARALAEAGASVIITGRDPEKGADAAAELGARVRFVAADMADRHSVDQLAHQGVIDILVNNAASFPGAMTVDQDVESFERTFATNVRGVYFLVAALAPGMIARGRGAIVNVTSMVAGKGVAGASTYSSSKAAVESLARSDGHRGRRGRMGRGERGTRPGTAPGAHRKSSRDRRRGALPGLAASELHHGHHPACRRWRRRRLRKRYDMTRASQFEEIVHRRHSSRKFLPDRPVLRARRRDRVHAPASGDVRRRAMTSHGMSAS